MSTQTPARPKAPKLTPKAAYDLYVKACEAAEAAVAKTVPTPMYVGTPKNMMGSLMGGDDGGFDPAKPVYRVNSGVCGFAWIKIRPANGAFVNMLKKRDVGRKGYNGGYDVSSWEFAASIRSSQSLELAEAAVRAAAGVLREAGVECYVQSRMD